MAAELHGDPPPIPKGVPVRVYSMEYCPFAHKVRLALSVKGVPFDVINCNLKRKPKFLVDANPDGSVPVLLHDEKVLYESEAIVEYVDEAFPGAVRLFPKDPAERAGARIMIINYSNKVLSALTSCVRKQTDETFANLNEQLEKFVENPLKKLGTPYFGGEQVNAVDVCLWPHLERIDAATSVGGFPSLPADRLPLLLAYIARMKETAGVKELVHPPEDHTHVRQSAIAGDTDYNYRSKYPIYAA